MFKKIMGLVFLSFALFSTNVFANIEFNASVTDPLLLLVDRTFVTYNPNLYQTEYIVLKAPNFMVQAFIDNSQSAYDLVLNTINLEIKFESKSNNFTFVKSVPLAESLFSFATDTFEPFAGREFRVLAGETKALGCDTCYIAMGDLLKGEYAIEDVQIKSLNFIFKGWFELNNLPIQNASQSFETSNIYY
jgi:hypothetical protein